MTGALIAQGRVIVVPAQAAPGLSRPDPARPHHIDEQTAALVFSAAMEVGKNQRWQTRVSPRGEEENMQAFMTAKVRPFLVISSVLAAWILLAAQPAQAHDSTVRLPAPSCGNLPTESGFLTAIPIGPTAPGYPSSPRSRNNARRGRNRARRQQVSLCQDYGPCAGRRRTAGV